MSNSIDHSGMDRCHLPCHPLRRGVFTQYLKVLTSYRSCVSLLKNGLEGCVFHGWPFLNSLLPKRSTPNRPMRTTQDLLDHNAAAKLLGISPRWLTGLIRQGALLPAKKGGQIRDNLYRPAEVNALLQLRSQALDLPTIANMAVNAQALGRSSAAKLDMLCQYLGIESNRLSHDEEDMYQLHLRVHAALVDDFSTLRTGAILGWASVFSAIDEAYLGLLEQRTEYASPWDIYLRLANELMDKRSEEADSNLIFAYACLDSSRRSLRHAAYFYVLSRHGQRTADKIFTRDSITAEVIAQLFPRLVTLSAEMPEENQA